MDEKKALVLERIRVARRRLDLNQEDMGKVIGITGQQYSRIERGEAELSEQRYKTLCEYLKLEIPDELLPTSLQENPIPMIDQRSFQSLVLNSLERVTAIESEINRLKTDRYSNDELALFDLIKKTLDKLKINSTYVFKVVSKDPNYFISLLAGSPEKSAIPDVAKIAGHHRKKKTSSP